MKPMTYERRIQLRMKSALVLIFLTFLLLLTSLYFGRNNAIFMNHLSIYIGGFCGMGGASIALFLRYRKLKKDPAALAKQELKEMDERNIFITRQAHVITTTAFLLLLFAAMILSGFVSQTIFYTLLVVLCSQLLLLGGVYLYVRKQY